jgi:hypothetical protein
MKSILCTLVIRTLPAAMHAATWTVDNNTAHPADFRTIQEAVDAAAVGDTILVAGSAYDYEGFTSTKHLYIKGERESSTGFNVRISGGSINFTEFFNDIHPDHLRNAAGSVFEGFECLSQITIYGPCSGVSINRCRGILQIVGCSGTMVRNCVLSGQYFSDIDYLNGRVFHGSGCTIIGSKLDIFNPLIPNTLFANCVIGNYVGGSSQLVGPVFTTSETAPFVIRNSILIGKTTIFTVPSSAYNGRVNFDHCLSIGGFTFPAGNGNVSVPYNQFASVFVDATPNTADPAAFVLKAGSPALGAGLNGADMGMYGGISPFVPNFIPALPRILQLTVPPLVPANTGLTFEVRAEARD